MIAATVLKLTLMFVPVAIILAMVAAAKVLLKTNKRDTEPLPYRARPYLLTKAEYSFYNVLREAIGNEGLIFAKVRLADLVDVQSGGARWQTAFNKIQSKHVDFVICDTKALTPKVLIELNDSSHNSQKRQARDNELAMICESASLPLVAIRQQQTYSTVQLYETIGPYLK